MRGPDRPEKLDKRMTSGEEGAAQRVLLLVLLLVVVLFGYLYFFTGVVKPREDVAPPPVAPVAKKPIPPRSGAKQPAGAGEQVAGKSDKGEPQASAEGTPPVEKGKPAPAEAKGEVQKPEQHAARPAVTAKTPAPAVKPPAKTLQTPKNEVKQVPVAEKKGTLRETKPEKVPAKASTAKAASRYALAAGEFVLDENLKRTQQLLKKSGVEHFTISTHMKSEPMHRVHLGDFATREEAAAALKKVQKAAEAAFILPANGKFSLYAGSYFNAVQAVKEKDRLTALLPGQSITVDAATVTVPVKRLVAGGYPDRKAAVSIADRLKKAGVATTVVPLQKAGR